MLSGLTVGDKPPPFAEAGAGGAGTFADGGGVFGLAAGALPGAGGTRLGGLRLGSGGLGGAGTFFSKPDSPWRAFNCPAFFIISAKTELAFSP